MVDAGLIVGVPLLLIGAALFIIEVIHPGAFLLIPGSVILAAGILYLVVPSLLTDTIFGPAIVVGVAFLATLATVPYYRHIAPVHRPLTTIPMSLEGETGVVTTAVEPDNMKGKVRVRSEIWSARSDRRIPEGTKVRILGGEGVSVRVAPLENHGTP
ncbi:MAG: NfeD family protein [Thermoplasmata archaeon]|nr:NfeD family protein [Thermoplasmata archaeon]MCI4332526.1 NfeD family protein [Thermoplasmata archaeon]